MAKSKNRKNIQPGDVFKALEKNEFEEFLPRLKEELNCKYIHEILPSCFYVFMSEITKFLSKHSKLYYNFFSVSDWTKKQEIW